MFDLARSLESAARNSETYMATPPSFNAAVLLADKALPDCDPTVNPSTLSTASSFQGGQKCFFCGYQRHPHSKCPARDATCSKCRKKGHFQKVCRSGAPPQSEGRRQPLCGDQHSLPSLLRCPSHLLSRRPR